MKKHLITGLLIWVPLVITVWVLSFLVGTLDQTLLLLPDDWSRVPGWGSTYPDWACD